MPPEGASLPLFLLRLGIKFRGTESRDLAVTVKLNDEEFLGTLVGPLLKTLVVDAPGVWLAHSQLYFLLRHAVADATLTNHGTGLTRRITQTVTRDSSPL